MSLFLQRYSELRHDFYFFCWFFFFLNCNNLEFGTEWFLYSQAATWSKAQSLPLSPEQHTCPCTTASLLSGRNSQAMLSKQHRTTTTHQTTQQGCCKGLDQTKSKAQERVTPLEYLLKLFFQLVLLHLQVMTLLCFLSSFSTIRILR